MRRRQDSSLNATQILKVAGVEKSKRTKVLEKEILIGEHEKVQGGYGKYQGTWIPYERGVELCRKYGVYDILEPLLTFDPNNVDVDKTPTKEQAMAAKRKRSSTLGPTAQLQHTNSLTFAHPLQVTGTGSSSRPTPLANSASAALSALGRRPDNNDPGAVQQRDATSDSYERDYMYLAHKNKRLRYDQIEGNGSVSNAAAAAAAVAAAVDVLDDEGIPDSNVPMSPLPEDGPNFEESRELVTQIFINTECNDLEQLLGGRDRLEMINVDVPIDESGHTALHWAAALARIPLVKGLIKCGANPRRGNYNGETPLVRAVLVTNNSDLSLLPELLDMLYPAIPLADHMGRTVLHHIALTAGIKGRSDASRYYLESLLEWIVRRGSRSKTGRLGLGRFMREIVNAQDKNGDTALNIATRVGNKSIAQQLLDVGADPNIPNRAQLRPIDFGLKVLAADGSDGHILMSSALMAQSAAAASTNSRASGASATEKRQNIVQSVHGCIDELEQDFQQELESKQRLIEDMHAQLREATINLAGRKERHDQLKSIVDQLVGLQRSSQNLERAIHVEDRAFKDVEERTGRAIQSSYGFDGNFDADQPFRIWLDSDDVTKGKIPPLLLQARISAYKRNEAILMEQANELRGRSVELERKFRKVVSLCTQVPEDQVDIILNGLVQAVESDGPNVDISRVAGFMRKVDDGVEA
jgi:regulatory protein SWI6